ncbi:MAG: hypothetical protein HC922_08405 [Leptolyngbyaceae cyanobacterium SM2_3_12]|nr:hypothetical protein [Leptolyngbyaceae cyanobacterium SM2_3_12]
MLSKISDFLSQLEVGPDSRLFIVEPDGTLVASSVDDLPYILVKGKAQRVNSLNSTDKLVRTTAQFLTQELPDGFQGVKAMQLFQFRYQGNRYFVQVLPWQEEYGLDWRIVLAVPESNFMAQIDANSRNTILLCLVALGVAVGLGLYTSRWINQPVLGLVRASAAIAPET